MDNYICVSLTNYFSCFFMVSSHYSPADRVKQTISLNIQKNENLQPRCICLSYRYKQNNLRVRPLAIVMSSILRGDNYFVLPKSSIFTPSVELAAIARESTQLVVLESVTGANKAGAINLYFFHGTSYFLILYTRSLVSFGSFRLAVK